jgi:hypothetical protein
LGQIPVDGPVHDDLPGHENIVGFQSTQVLPVPMIDRISKKDDITVGLSDFTLYAVFIDQLRFGIQHFNFMAIGPQSGT